MAHYYIWPADDDRADSYSVLAFSSMEARQLVALNIAEADAALDPDAFGCRLDNSKAPPEGLIYRGRNGPLPILRRPPVRP